MTYYFKKVPYIASHQYASKIKVEAFRNECQQAVETSKLSYLRNLGNKADNPNTVMLRINARGVY